MKFLKNKLITTHKNYIWIKFSPFLLLYLLIVLVFNSDSLFGDENRYLMFAQNLLNGFYSPPPPNINLWNGPGYPLLISAFLFFKLPLISIRLLNGVLLFLSLVISYKTFLIYFIKKKSTILTFALGLYYPIYEMLPMMFTECLSWFLISLICFLFICSLRRKTISLKYLILTSLTVAFLALTKLIFGYAIILALFISLFMLLLPKYRNSAKRTSLIFLFSLILCLPYLSYTYKITDKLFYWGNSGGMSLYTMSTPFPDEFGDWSDTDQLSNNANHKAFMEEVMSLPPLKRDEAFRNQAIENIKLYPKKYVSNVMANVGRLLFSFPFSNTNQSLKPYFTVAPNMFIVVFLILSLILGIFYYKKLPQEFIFLSLFMLIYLFGSSLLSAYRRMFFILIPYWVLFISYVFTYIVSITIKKE